MIRVWALGGLGNQLFQYALYYYLNLQGKDVCLDLSDFPKYELHNGFELTKVFEIDLNVCYSRDDSRLFRLPIKIVNRLKHMFFDKLQLQFLRENKELLEYRNSLKNSVLFEMNNVCLKGYWQKEAYLKTIRSNLQNILNFRLDQDMTSYHELLNNPNVILVHVRGGDYVSLRWTLSGEYYTNASRNFQYLTNPEYIVITDDVEFLETLSLPFNYKVIDDFKGSNSYLNMYLFSQAKNIILSNSTFSWWGAYLNKSAKKVVVPISWIPRKGYEAIYYPSEWIKVDV